MFPQKSDLQKVPKARASEVADFSCTEQGQEGPMMSSRTLDPEPRAPC